MGDWFYELYYTSKTAAGWSDPLKISGGRERGYVVKMAVDNQNRIHIVQSSVSTVFGAPWGNVTYYQVYNNSLIKSSMITNPNQKEYRVDNRFEIDCRKTAYLHLVVGCPDPSHGPVYYYRSFDGG